MSSPDHLYEKEVFFGTSDRMDALKEEEEEPLQFASTPGDSTTHNGTAIAEL